jgi:hypothetical protein
MENLPLYISLFFVLVTLFTVILFYHATNKSKAILIVVIAWLALQGIVGLAGFYVNAKTTPPRFPLLVAPPILTIILLFATKKGRALIDSFNPKILTYLHVVRIPVEISLLLLFLHKQVPQVITFEGRNFDIFSGISAIFIGYFGYTKMKLGKPVLVLWNLLCIGLLFNVVILAVLAVPTNFQQIAFDQPNVGVLYFPFIWLPCFIVPVVLLAHLVCLRNLMKK